MRIDIKAIIIFFTAVLALFTMTLPVLAQDLPETKTESTSKETLPPGIYPALTLDYKSNDNILRLDNRKIYDNVYSVRPSLTLMSLFGKHSFEASYFADIIRYQNNSDENFTDHYVDGQLNLDLTRKLKMRFVADYATAHELRGASGTRVTLSETPDAWWGDRMFGEVSYGRRTHRNQIVVSAESYRRRYTNNFQQPRSRDQQNFKMDFYHNWGAKTRMLIEGRYSSFDYFDKSAPIDLTSKELSLMAGLTWEATAKTTGTVKVGYLSKDLTDKQLPDFEGWSAWADVNWEMKPYSVISLMVSRRTKESPQTVGSFYVSNEIGVNWRHDLSERWVLLSKLLFQNDEYSKITDIERSDDLADFELEIAYSLLRWLDIGGIYHYSSRQSTYPGIDYKANTFMIQVAADSM